MKHTYKYIFLLSLFIGGFSLFPGNAGRTEIDLLISESVEQQVIENPDTGEVRFPVQRTQIADYGDLQETRPIDLRTPSNIQTEIVYDHTNNVYQFRTKVGDNEWMTPFTLTPEEYREYTLKRSMSDYFRNKNAEAFERGPDTEEFSLKDIKIDIGPAERIFGPGGIRFTPQGYAELKMGMRRTSIDDPTRSERNRTRTTFDMEEKIQLSVNASIGDKMNFDLNYDTEATFDFDSKRIKLAYEGKEDEIIRYLEGGNVSLNTTNSLISGATSLFGIRADLQFGKLRVNSVISQQESETQSVNSKGGVQTTPYEFKADAYDENRHFFLGHYFRDQYDEAMSTLPYIKSNISITNMEVWITNKRGNFEEARNIVAFADLAERDSIKNNTWTGTGSKYPSNKNNTLYPTIATSYSEIRDMSNTTSVLNSLGLESGLDYEKLENARKLSSSEYSYSTQLGYISLNFSLQSDEVLAVAYTYTLNGETYQVGEFAKDITDTYNQEDEGSYNDGTNSGALILKLLKPVSLSPRSYTWHLMMKNVYALGGYNLQPDKFRLNISYQSDTTGTYINYIPEGDIKDELLLRVMNLDRLNSRQNAQPDGIFDYVEGYTVKSSDGRIFFPVVEPFGSHLRKKIGNNQIAEKYVFQELYDETLTAAKQVAEKNKFKIYGTYKASNNNEISLNAINVARGSVKVTAGGVLLTEGIHYTVDYSSGTVYIIDQSITDTGTAVNVSLESNGLNLQKKTLLGMNLSYDFTKNFNVGGTIMHMYEKPLTVKTEIGNETVKNTLWGLNTSYRTESQWLTSIIDKIPFVNATAPSQIALNAEFAHMIPGHYQNKYSGGYSYLDDFESSQSSLSLRDAYGWFLSSTPADDSLFSEAKLSNNIHYGKKRAHLAWYTIDDMFTRKNSSLTPSHIKANKDETSNHFVRRINMSELYPFREASYTESAAIPALNLSFYPQERGPYNLVPDDIGPDGKFRNPKEKWGGITRKMNVKDFETSNYEYIEFWLMDPFIYNDNKLNNPEFYNSGGYLYFNLGEVSEDVLKDGRKFFENGLPLDGDFSAVDTTVWGKVPNRQSTVYAFDNTNGTEGRKIQDVGLDGLSTEEEHQYRDYKNYVEELRRRVTDPTTVAKWEQDPFSPFNDPAGDNYHHFRGSDYDAEEKGILDRYKYYNGTEGNSQEGTESYSTAARSTPDVEDMDQDYTMNETESFYQYKVKLDPNEMIVGQNFINESREVTVTLPNGKTENVTWYQFKVPITEYEKTVGSIQDFKSIRFMRMFLYGFEQPAHLRFGTLDLVRSEWRIYTKSLVENNVTDEGSINTFFVNIEENGNKEPVNYVLPPGLSRMIDPGQPQLRQENEQALALRVLDLYSQKATRAIYKNVYYDLRRYKRLQMFTHAENLIDNTNQVKKGELTIFLRLGSDYKNNYYEYEIPLTITPHGTYNNNNTSDRQLVWPEENMFDFPLELLKNVKLNRNAEKRKVDSEVSYTTIYSENDPDKPGNKVSVVGNPSLSDINVIMVGVRNQSREPKSAEIWINELRLTDFDEEGGWAAQGNLNIALSDIGTINISGRKETAGFGSIDQSLMQRRQDDYHTYSIAANVDIGRFLPEQAKATIPMYYAYTNETTTPKYDPLDQDVTLKEAISLVNTKAEKDSIRNMAQDKTVTKSFSLSGVRFNLRSSTPMPYDPANFSFGYAQSITEASDPTTAYDITKEYKVSASYSYSPMVKTWEPFKNIKSKAPIAKFPKSIGFNYLPNNISFNSLISRYYTETLIRDLESYNLGEDNSMYDFRSWSQEFYWNRDFSLTWDFTRNLKASIQTGTKAEIEEPYSNPVNKKLFPEFYEVWKDSVRQSLKNLGSPLQYKQNASVSYTLPLNNIPFLDWATASYKYDSYYTWDKGATVSNEYKIGNTITNGKTITMNGRFNLLNLYNKSDFLKKTNQKFASTSSARSPGRPARPERIKKFEQEITLSADTGTILSHNLNMKNIRVTAKRYDGKTYPVKYKRVDNNTIYISNQDTTLLNMTVTQGKNPEETTWYKIAQYSSRGLMSVRNISINYSNKNENYIYGFQPNIGDIFGQNQTNFGMTPGVGFAFGFEGGEKYVNKALNNNWLLENDSMNINPAIFNRTERLDIQVQLEPVRGLKIDLKTQRSKTNRTEMYYMYDGRPRNFGGSYSISILSISSAFESHNADDGYYSKTFEKFLVNRNIIASRYREKYARTDLPNTGFLAGSGLNTYTPGENGYSDINNNSADVLIPAFLAAYTGKNPDKISLSPFPSLSSMLPGWSVTYEGLIAVPWVKSKFKSLKFMHTYESIYNVGSYSSISGWIDAGNGRGFVQNHLDTSDGITAGSVIASSGMDITSVSITESFTPLFGAEGTLNNSMTLNARYNLKRTLALNISAYQIVENLQKELVIGMGYRINEFNRVIGLSDRGTKGFNNDLDITANISHKFINALLRKIEENYSQATSGSKVTTLKLSANYALSRSLTMMAYFDKVINTPLVSASSYPTTNTNFGISIRFSLTQ